MDNTLIFLSETEKVIFTKIMKGESLNRISLDRDEVNYAVSLLNQKGLIKDETNGDLLYRISITPQGRVYYKRNPSLENPLDISKIKEMQLEELEHSRKMRWFENINTLWKTLGILFSIIIFLFVFFFRCFTHN